MPGDETPVPPGHAEWLARSLRRRELIRAHKLAREYGKNRRNALRMARLKADGKTPDQGN